MIHEIDNNEKWEPVTAYVVNELVDPEIECRAVRPSDSCRFRFRVSRYSIDKILSNPIGVDAVEIVSDSDDSGMGKRAFVVCIPDEFIPWLEGLGVLVKFEQAVKYYEELSPF